MSQEIGVDGIAVVGLAGRFPGAANVTQFWRNLCAGVESVSFFTDEELETSGIDSRGLPSNYVKARAVLEAPEWFDAGFFGFGPREAEILDPQQRVFLETAWEALEDAGCDPEQFAGSVGVFAGMANNTYYLSNLHGHPELLAAAGAFATMLANEKDFLATRTSYKLNLTGPSLNINTACSTSLVAVCQACHGLMSYQCDLALAGGVAIDFPQKKGSLYQEGGTTSSDGHCRAFDERATGMVLGEGVGVVALRRLSDALADGDHVYAVIRGFAVNNDGAHKVGYAAPSVEGQAEVIALAQAMADLSPDTITYIEAHGTGTPLGDPIEIAALTRAFRGRTNARGFCAIGSVKTNIGHLEAAAGVAGLIKTVLALRHGLLPASLHFTKPNPKIDFANSPFFVNDQLRHWVPGGPRRAGVSSFGIGGTNAHVVLEEAPARVASGPPGPCEILVLSAKSSSALARMSANLADYLRTNPDANLADVAYTLQVGRQAFPYRRVALCSDRADALRALEDVRLLAAPADAHGPSLEVANLWLRGAPVDWPALHVGQQRHKISLPTYPFERQRYWVAPARRAPVGGDDREAAPARVGPLIDEVRTLFQEISGLPTEQMSTATTIAELGLDSLALAQASLAIERQFGVRVGFRQLQESFPTLASLADHLAAGQRPRTGAVRPTAEERPIGPFQPPATPEQVEQTPEQHERVARLIERYTKRTARSKQMAQEHRAHFADPRTAAGFRAQWKEMVYPIVVDRSLGARLHDVDGNEYVDLQMGFGVDLFGHSPDFVTRALQEQLGRGVEIGPQSPLAGQVAAAICGLTGAERATFCNTGSEAVLAALRIARASTNRDKVALFAGSYHGIFDEVLFRAPTTTRPQVVPIAAGIVPTALANIHVLEYGDPRALDFVAEHSRELAAVLVEPVQSRNPELQPRDFLHQLRQLTEDNGVALIFDEIITGFRCHPGGAQAHFGVRADIATYGKVLGGGMPMGAVAGKSRFLDALDGGTWQYGDSSSPSRGTTYLAGTFVRHPLALAAADAVLRRLNAEGPKLQETLNERTANLAQTLRQLLADSGLPLRLGHFSSLMFLRPTEPEPLASLLFYHLRARGIHLWEGRPAFLSTAHTDQDLATIESAFAASLADLTGRTVVAVSPPPSAAGRVALPMTPAQTDLWIAASLGAGASLSYNLSYLIHARGPLDPEPLRRALQDLVDRHEALRTTFDAHGRYQSIWDQMAIDVPLRDVSGLPPREAQAALEEAVEQAAQQPFDLENGPLFRAWLVKLAAAHHALILTAHHLVVDGWSFGVLLEEMVRLYTAHLTGAAASLPPPLAARAYARLAQEQLTPAKIAANRDYWLQQFARLPDPLELPAARPRPAARSYRAATVSFVLDGETAARLRGASAGLGCGLTHLLLTSYSALLHRLSTSDDFVVGIPATSSLSDDGLRIKGDRSLVGDHVNVLPLRMRHRPEQTFEEHLRSVKDLVLGGYEHQDFAFAELVRELGVPRDPGHVPLISVMFNFERAVSANAIEGVEIEVVLPPKAFDFFDLSFNIVETGHDLRVDFTFNTDLFDAEVIRAWLAAWRVLLEAAAAAPGSRVVDLPLLSPLEQEVILERWNATDRALPDECVHRRIASQARQTPDAIAVEPLTYRELHEEVGRLAGRLREVGIGPDRVVGLCIERSPQLLVGLLAILQAGGAYLPLDPSLPDERLRFMLEDAGAAVLVTQSHLQDRFRTTATVIDLDEPLPTLPIEGEGESLDSDVGPGHLAYVIYTSGSTGRPKGVAVEHRALTNLLHAVRREIDLRREDVLLAVTTISFDIAALELLMPLLVGARVALATRQTASDGRALLRALRTTGATVMQATPVTWRLLLDAGWEGETPLKVLCGGESLPPGLAQELLRRSEQVWNLYGPTETTIWSSSHRVTQADAVVPIGRPLANTRMYILGPRGEPVPVGVPGDLFISGTGLARGYWGRPDLTNERFLHLPLGGDDPVRLYRTGDRARYRPDGVIEFLGRQDHQVKLRGFRIELGEVEAVLSRHPAVKQTLTLVREDAPGDHRLVAYVIPRDADSLELADLRGFARQRLPEYMVPAAWVVLTAFPLNSNGKIDRDALPPPHSDRPDLQAAYQPPRGPAEELLAAIWQEVLDLREVGVQDNFFDLGGHSLLATQTVARIRSVFSVDLPLRALFEAPTVARLAQRLRSAPANVVPPLTRAARPEPLPLSFAQQRLWFLDRWQPDSPLYNISGPVRLLGPLNRAALRDSLQEIVRRHEALRTGLPAEDGSPRQQITEAVIDLPVIELGALPEVQRLQEMQRQVQTDADQPFDLATGPLFRCRLLRLAEQEHVLLLTWHHSIFDGWSWEVFWRELSELYAALAQGRPSPLRELPIQYADYTLWQRHWLRDEALERQLAFWQARLAGLSPLDLPTDRPRPAIQSIRGSRVPVQLSAELTERLAALGRCEGVTLFMVVLAGWQALLARYTGQTDIAVGVPVAGRTYPTLEALIGFFANTLVLRADLSGQPTGRDLLARTREAALAAYEHQDVPFELLVERLSPARDPSRPPVFQVMLAWQNLSATTLAGLDVEPVAFETRTAKLELMLSLGETATRGLEGELLFNSDLFDESTAARMVGHLEVLLSALADDPGAVVDRLPLLSQPERRQLLVEFNATESDYPREACLHELFEAQAADAPDALAVVFQDQRLSYEELNRRANRLAHQLRSLGVGPEVCVGLCVERSPEMVIGMLGILKAGGAYVPLDPALPNERLTFLLEDARIAVLLSQERQRQRLSEHGVHVVCLDAAAAPPTRDNAANPVSGATAQSLAHVLYTSGSTGTPKGVMGTHQAAVNRLAWMWRAFPFSPGEVCCQKTAFTFVDSVWEVFGPLLRGVPLVILPDEARMDPQRLLDELARFEVSRLVLVPSLLRAVLDCGRDLGSSVPRLRYWVSSGEALPGDLCRRFHQRGAPGLLVNLYGSTEAAGDSTCYEVTDPSLTTSLVPIGRPIANTQVHVLDPAMQPVPVGVVGELYIGGDGLARGYLNRPALTADKFVPDPFSGRPGARLYRTGDLARWRTDGNLEFLGRRDHQVKLRGFRIELGEVEAVLSRHPAVKQTLTLAREDAPGDHRLVAYVIPRDADSLELADLRGFARQRLPEYMVPAAWVVLTAFPLNSNGKIDRDALPPPHSDRPDLQAAYQPPRGPAEELLATIWQEVLDLREVGVQDNFFDLGGHSLLAVKLFARLETALGRRLPLATLFQAPTIAQLAEVLRREDWLPPWSALVALQPRGQRPPFVCVHGFGGEVLGYRDLALRLGEDQPFYSFQAPGGQLGENLSRDVETMAAAYLRELRQFQPRGPYYLGGLSFGGIVAFEMAQHLVAQGETVALLALFDSYCPGHFRRPGRFQTLWQHGRKLTDLGLRAGLAYLGENLLAQPRRLRRWSWRLAHRVSTRAGWTHLPAHLPRDMRSRIAMITYRPRPYPGQVTLFRAAERLGGNDRDPFLGWDRVALAGVVLEEVPGDHATMVQEPNVRTLAQRLRARLESAQAGTERDAQPRDSRRERPRRAEPSALGAGAKPADHAVGLENWSEGMSVHTSSRNT